MRFSTFFFYTVLISLCGSLHGVHIKIYKDRKFKGLIYDEDVQLLEWPGNCHDIKSYARGMAGSVKIDTCLMMYENTGCSGNSFKLSRDMTETLEALGREVSSFHPCNETFGAGPIRVELHDSSWKTLVKFHDICGCQDVASLLSTKVSKLNNFGNCIMVYGTDNCADTGDKEEIPAGQNILTQNLTSLGFYVRSLSPCGSRRTCVRLTSEIFKFVLLPDPAGSAAVLAAPKEVSLATKTVFYNNGSATVIQEYEATEKVKESTSIEVSRSFYEMYEYRVKAGVNGSVGVEGYDTNSTLGEVSATAGAHLNVAYSSKQESMNKETSTTTTEEEKEFTVRQAIEVPPCTRYEVSSIVEVVENLPMYYEVYAMITGESGGQKVTAQEVSEIVDDLTFVEVYDEYTAIFKSTHKLVASVGVETKISGEGTHIAGCVQ